MPTSKYFYARGQQVFGPFTASQLKDEAAAGRVRPEDRIAKQGNAKWTRARRVVGLFPKEVASATEAADALPADDEPLTMEELVADGAAETPTEVVPIMEVVAAPAVAATPKPPGPPVFFGSTPDFEYQFNYPAGYAVVKLEQADIQYRLSIRNLDGMIVNLALFRGDLDGDTYLKGTAEFVRDDVKNAASQDVTNVIAGQPAKGIGWQGEVQGIAMKGVNVVARVAQRLVSLNWVCKASMTPDLDAVKAISDSLQIGKEIGKNVAPTPPADATKFHYIDNGKQTGPVPFSQLRALATQRKLRPGTSVWQNGMPQWVPAARIDGLMPARPFFGRGFNVRFQFLYPDDFWNSAITTDDNYLMWFPAVENGNVEVYARVLPNVGSTIESLMDSAMNGLREALAKNADLKKLTTNPFACTIAGQKGSGVAWKCPIASNTWVGEISLAPIGNRFVQIQWMTLEKHAGGGQRAADLIAASMRIEESN